MEDRIQLTWKTAQEINNERFQVEKSLNGSFWATIGGVDGAGNSTEVITYNFSDLYPDNGVQFYRLKQIDFNGKHEYSPIISVDFNSIGSSTILYPNPSNGELHIGLEEAPLDVLVRIIDLRGITVHSQVLESGGLTIDISALPDKVYNVEVIINGRRSIHTIVKN